MKLADVASRAGVSISTVSRVLNGKKNSLVTEATAERVWQVAPHLGGPCALLTFFHVFANCTVKEAVCV